MADTWRVLFQDVTFAAPKIMAAICNNGTNIIKVRRVGFINARTTTVSGVIAKGEIRRYTAASLSGGSAGTPIAYDTTNASLSSVTVSSNSTPSGSYINIANYIWSTDEPAVSGGTIDIAETFTNFGIQIDYGYGDSSVQPITLRQDQSIVLYNTTGAAGQVDIWIEFTNEAE